MAEQATRPITADELAEHLAHDWTCCRCRRDPTHVHVRLGYRLCALHARMVELNAVSQERDIYRQALERIAREESGGWGTIAHQALRAGDELPKHPEPGSLPKLPQSIFHLETDRDDGEPSGPSQDPAA